MRGLIFPPTNNFTQLKLTPVFFTDRISLYDIYGPYIMYVKGKGSGSEDWGAGGGVLVEYFYMDHHIVVGYEIFLKIFWWASKYFFMFPLTNFNFLVI